MDGKPIKITVTAHQKWSALNYLRMMFFCVVPIGIGIATGSSAMQWLGFVVTIAVALAAAKHNADATTAISIADARKLLDKLEAEQPPA